MGGDPRQDPKLLDQLFPFRFDVDDDLRFSFVGPSLARLAPGAVAGTLLLDSFECRAPETVATIDALKASQRYLFVLAHRGSGAVLRGQFICDGPSGASFFGSPWLTRTAELTRFGLTVSDFALHDPVLDGLHLLQAYEQAIQEAREPNVRLQRFFSLSPDLFCMIGFDGDFKLLNPAWEKVLGHTRAELMAKPFDHFTHPDDQERTRKVLARLADGGQTIAFENRYRGKDGSWKTLRWNAIPDTERSLVFASARDIGNEVEARELSGQIVAAAPTGMLLVDTAGSVVLANASAERLLAAPAGGLLGRSVEELVPATLRGGHAHHREAFAAAPVVKRMGVQREVTALRGDGHEIPVEIVLNPLRLGSQAYVLAVLSDISARKALEQDMVRARDAALELARAKSEFLANMSHEIRTPLNAIIGSTSLILETALDDKQAEYARIARTAGDALLSLVNDILDFSRVEAGKLLLENVDFDPREAVDEAVELVAEQARTKGLRMTACVSRNTPQKVRGDPGRLRQVLLNLLSNAVKFTDAGTIRVDATHEAGRMVFSVTDTGIGIDDAVIPGLFAAFTQADTSTTRKYGGSGLGLAICSRIVALMGGHISVASRRPGGTTFRFDVPFPAVESAGDAPPLAGRRVFVAVTDVVLRSSLGELLHAAGAELAETPAGCHAAVSDGDDEACALLVPTLASGARIVRLAWQDARSRFACVPLPVRSSRLVSILCGARLPDAASRTGPPRLRLPRRRVLLVEDNAVNQRVALAMFHNLGQVADAVASGPEALEAMSRGTYDVAFMDCQMPGMDGFETTEEWRRREPAGGRLPIVAMTASAMLGDRERCFQAGMDEYLTKPVRMDQIAAVLGRLLKPYDRDRLAELKDLARDTEPGLLEELRSSFERDMHALVARLRSAIASADSEAALQATHRLMGASANLGFTSLSAAAHELQGVLRKRDTVASLRALAVVEEEVPVVQAALADFHL